MTITRNDIKIRHNEDSVTVWLSERVVIERCGVSSGYLRKSKTIYKQALPTSWRKATENQEYFLGDTGKAWRYGFKDGSFWYDLDRIPDRAPACYRSLLPSKQELVDFMSEVGGNVISRERWAQVKNEVEEKVEDLIDIDDVNYYKHYGSEITGKALAAKKTLQLAESVAWVTFIKNSVEDGYYHTLGFKTIKEFYAWVAPVIAERKLEGLKISTGRSLRNKIDLIAGDRMVVRKALVSAKYGNTNAAILGKKTAFVDTATGEVRDIAVHETLMLSYYMNFGGAGKGAKTELYKKYQVAMDVIGERPVSLSLFSKYLGTSRIQELTSLQRHGKEYFNKMVQTYVPSRKLEYANSLWCADASGTISYRYYTKKGEIKTRKLYTIFVSDVASGYIAGYAVGKEKISSENYNSMREAVASAVSNPLNDKKRVLEFLSDNHGSYTSQKSKEYLKTVAKRVRTIAPHNSQGNPAERLFRVFKHSLRGLYNLFDTSFAAQSVENQANPDYFDKSGLPTYEEAKKQLEGIIESFNNRTLTDGTTPQERFANTKNPQCGTYTEQEYRLITTAGTEMDIAKSRGIFKVMRDGVSVRYELPIDAESKAILAKHAGYSTGLDVTVYADGDSADIYTEDGVYIMTAKRVAEACISVYEATDEEKRIRQYHERRKQQQLQDVIDFEEGVLEDVSCLRGGDRFGLEMAANGYTKESYNARKEELINSKTKVKDEKKAIRKAARYLDQEEKEKEQSHFEMIKKKHANYTNKTI